MRTMAGNQGKSFHGEEDHLKTSQEFSHKREGCESGGFLGVVLPRLLVVGKFCEVLSCKTRLKLD